MGWFLRKSFRVGPLRLNPLERGVGALVDGVYFRQRLGAGQASQTPGAVGMGGDGQTANRHPRFWWVLVMLALLVGFILGVVLAGAGETKRIDLFDANGRRTGYAVVDRDTGRVDFYDTMSRRTGYGRVDGAGKVDRFGLDGKREGETVVPVLPRGDRPR